MDGDTKFMLCVYCLFAICVTTLYCVLFYALWEYRAWVGASLLAIVMLLAVVYTRGKYTEQELRRMRFRHKEETPLDTMNESVFWHADVQPNPHRAIPQHQYYQEYRQQ